MAGRCWHPEVVLSVVVQEGGGQVHTSVPWGSCNGGGLLCPLCLALPSSASALICLHLVHKAQPRGECDEDRNRDGGTTQGGTWGGGGITVPATSPPPHIHTPAVLKACHTGPLTSESEITFSC